MLVDGPHRRLLHLRLHDPDHLVHVLRRAPRPPPSTRPARDRSPHHRAAHHPRRPGGHRRLRQPARQRHPLRRPDEHRAALRALRRAHRRLLPGGVDAAFHHPEFNIGIAIVSTLVAARRPSCSPTSGTGRASAPTASPSATGSPAPATRCSRTSTTWTGSTPTSIAGGVKGPIARASQLGQPERDRRRRQRRRARRRRGRPAGSTTTSTRAWSTPSSTAPAPPPRASGQILRKLQTGKVQQYGAYLFAGRHLLAAIFVIVIAERR